MRFAERHVTMAKILAERQGGITARELAKNIKRSERLAAAIIQHVLTTDPTGKYRMEERATKRPGPQPRALVVADD